MVGGLDRLAPVRRLRRALDRHGATATARLLAGRARRLIYLAERHVWLEFPPPELPLAAPPEGYGLRRGGPADVEALDALGVLRAEVGHAHLAAGERLWVGIGPGDELVYCIWVHRVRVPAVAARHGELRLPRGVGCFEGAYAMPEHRHLGLGRRVFRQAMLEEAAAGCEHVVARIAVDNIPSRRSAAKLGAREIATARLVRVGPWRRLRIEAVDAPAEPLTRRLREAHRGR